MRKALQETSFFSIFSGTLEHEIERSRKSAHEERRSAMKLTVLGNNSTTAMPGGACSSYLLESGGRKILLDAGNGSIFNLKKILKLEEVDAVILTHHHFDHISDLFLFRYEREGLKYMGQEVPAIPLYSPAMEPWLYEKLEKSHIFDFHFIQGETESTLFDLKIRFIPVEHLVETYAVRVESQGRVFAYSSDTGLCEGILKASDQADLFLCEASYLSEEPYRMRHHLHGQEAAGIAVQSQVQRLLLTHLPENRHRELLLEAQEIHRNTELSEILATYEV